MCLFLFWQNHYLVISWHWRRLHLQKTQSVILASCHWPEVFRLSMGEEARWARLAETSSEGQMPQTDDPISQSGVDFSAWEKHHPRLANHGARMCWDIYLQNWLMYVAQVLVNIPAPWSIWAWWYKKSIGIPVHLEFPIAKHDPLIPWEKVPPVLFLISHWVASFPFLWYQILYPPQNSQYNYHGRAMFVAMFV